MLHVNSLLQDMASEELNLKTKLEESLESNTVELFDLCKQLSLEKEKVSQIILQTQASWVSDHCLSLHNFCLMLSYNYCMYRYPAVMRWHSIKEKFLLETKSML